MDSEIAAFLRYQYAELNASPHTLDAYQSDLAQFRDFLAGKKIAWQDVNREVMRDFVAMVHQTGAARTTIARKRACLHSFYRFQNRERLVSAMPVIAKPPRLPQRLPHPLNVHETVRLLRAPDISTPAGLRDHAILELLYASGMRVSELVALNIDGIDWRGAELRVWGKGAKERIVVIGDPALRALDVYIKAGRPALHTERRPNEAALFLNQRGGGRLSDRAVRTLVDQYAKAAHIVKEVTPHTLRHTFATHMLDGGADLRTVQELMGHEDLASTQIYTHVSQSQARRIYEQTHPRGQRRPNGETMAPLRPDDDAAHVRPTTPARRGRPSLRASRDESGGHGTPERERRGRPQSPRRDIQEDGSAEVSGEAPEA